MSEDDRRALAAASDRIGGDLERTTGRQLCLQMSEADRQLRPHAYEPAPAWLRPISELAYRIALDPDGGPRELRHSARY